MMSKTDRHSYNGCLGEMGLQLKKICCAIFKYGVLELLGW